MQHWSEVPEHVPGQIVSPADALAEYDREIKGLEDEKKRRGLNRIETFFPLTGPHRRELYPKHMAFFRAGKYYRARCFSAGNRCLVASSVLELCGPGILTRERTVAEILHSGNAETPLASWRDGRLCWEPASSIFLKGYGPAVRLHLSNGQTFDCGLSHEILDAEGAYRNVYEFSAQTPTALGVFIEKIEDLDDQIIVDLKVPRTNCYVSQGLVSHNCGKTIAGSFELALHMTGIYPDWWPGRRFENAGLYWACGTTNETTKNILQAELLGRLEKDTSVSEDVIGLGTGMIPANLITGVEFHAQIRGAIKTAWIKHVSGRRSELGFRSFEAGQPAFEGVARQGILLDEEPPLDVYTECLMRLMTTDGCLMLTSTPLKGLTDVVAQFMPDGVVPEWQSCKRCGQQLMDIDHTCPVG